MVWKILRRTLGYRWSLYLTQGRTIYCMAHSHDGIALLNVVAPHFLRLGDPAPPWELLLNFNSTDSIVKLRADRFQQGPTLPTDQLLKELMAMDPKLFEKHDKEVVAVDVITKKQIPMYDLASVVLAVPQSGPPYASFGAALNQAFPRS